MSYKRIIVAVDGSKTSDLALIEALHLAKALQAEICIIYIADIFPIIDFSPSLDFDVRDIIRNDGLAVLEKMRRIAQKNDVSTETQLIEILDDKTVSEKISETALSWKADLIVMGTHGRRGFNRVILGSVAEETIRISSIPVLLIRGSEVT